MKIVRQPEGSHQCGQACVAMAAGVSLKRSIKAVGHERSTHTSDLIRGLRALGVECADKLVRICRRRPHFPPRAIIAIHRPAVKGERREAGHWMVAWDGEIIDPAGRYPDGFQNWKMTSYLEIK